MNFWWTRLTQNLWHDASAVQPEIPSLPWPLKTQPWPVGGNATEGLRKSCTPQGFLAEFAVISSIHCDFGGRFGLLSGNYHLPIYIPIKDKVWRQIGAVYKEQNDNLRTISAWIILLFLVQDWVCWLCFVTLCPYRSFSMLLGENRSTDGAD